MARFRLPRVGILVAALGSLLFSGSACRAGIIITPTDPGPALDGVKFFSPGTDSLTQTGQVGNTAFHFTAQSDLLMVSQGGNSLEPSSGSTLANTLTLFPADFYGFGKQLSINLGMNTNGVGIDDLKVTVSAVDSTGNALPDTVAFLDEDGQNPFRVSVAETNGEIVTRVILASVNGASITESKQIRIEEQDGGIVLVDPATGGNGGGNGNGNGVSPAGTLNGGDPLGVPEPASVLLWSTLGIGILARRYWVKRRPK